MTDCTACGHVSLDSEHEALCNQCADLYDRALERMGMER